MTSPENASTDAPDLDADGTADTVWERPVTTADGQTYWVPTTERPSR